MYPLVPQDRREALERTVEPLATLSTPWVFVFPFVPVSFVVVVFLAAYTITMGADPGFPSQFANVPLGVGYVGVVTVLFLRSDSDTWNSIALFRRPSFHEIGSGILLAGVGIGILTGVNAVAQSLGAPLHEPGRVETGLGLGGLLLASVVAAPVIEEVLFRGLLFGHLFSRGHGLRVAAALSVLAFGVYHLLVAGAASVAVGVLLGTLLTVLRVWYDNLVGAWLMHLLVNLWAFLIAISAVPAPW